MYPFSMYGRIVQVHRYSVTYLEESQWEPDAGPVERIEYCHTREQADSVAECTGGTVTDLDSSAYEWLDGIEVADVPDTYAEAVRIYEMGREAYEAELAKPTPQDELAALQAENAMLKGQVTDLETQTTDLQLALCELYEGAVE